jgi:SpoVK/Ycf46/Vps4 family AAA+-type ATPase
MYKDEVKKISTYIKAGHPLFYIQHSDFFAVKEIMKELKKDEIFSDYKFYEFTYAREINYGTPFDSDDFEADEDNHLDDWLSDKYKRAEKNEKQFLVLKDILNGDNDSYSISYIKEIAEKSVINGNKIIIIIAESRTDLFPKELESLLTIIDIKPLNDEDIKSTIRKFVDEYKIDCPFIDNTDRMKEFSYPFKGLQQYQIEQILATAVVKRLEKKGDYKLSMSNEQLDLVLEEKEQLIKKSGILEIINHSGNFDKIGGLEGLKSYLRDKEVVYKDIVNAKEFGVERPKGILIAGMPGCGKSLAAKSTATLFNVPLVRLDIGSLLGKYIGESEANMRKALSLSESFSPCVLWIDELEKAFAGINGGGKNEGSEVVMRLFGQFLTWMQEKDNDVYIVATANDIDSLPPELLRRGRFDDLFFVKLPNQTEREKIFRLKFESKKKDVNLIDFSKLAMETEGYAGSDIESIVNTAIEKKYIELKRNNSASKQFTTDFVLDIAKSKKSISKMLGDKIKKLEEKYKELDLINASE